MSLLFLLNVMHVHALIIISHNKTDKCIPDMDSCNVYKTTTSASYGPVLHTVTNEFYNLMYIGPCIIVIVEE